MDRRIIAATAAGVGAVGALNVLHAALHTTKKKTYPAPAPERVNVQRYTEALQGAIRCKTVSNPDFDKMDWGEFEKLHAVFEEKYPLIHKTLKREQVGPAALIYTWEGSDPDLKPIALLGHQDVVPVPEEKVADWTHPPFEAEIADGYLWGRGAIDMKNHLVGVLESVETLLEDGFQPKRTVLLCFGCNEEVVASDCPTAALICKTLADRGVQLESVLDEGGGLIGLNVPGVIDKTLTGIGIAEKGYADFEISVDAKGGHSSAPPKHSAVGVLATAIADLENNQFKSTINPQVKNILDVATRGMKFPARLLGCNIKYLLPILKPILSAIPQSASLVRTTTAVTMTSGSPQANVLPQHATATVNFRVMPGSHISDVEDHIRKVVRSRKVGVRLIGGNEPSVISPTDSDSFNALKTIAHSMYENAMVVPYIVMGGTDARHYQPLTDQMYRLSPFRMGLDIVMLSHGTDERISVDSFGDGIAFFKRYIKTMAG